MFDKTGRLAERPWTQGRTVSTRSDRYDGRVTGEDDDLGRLPEQGSTLVARLSEVRPCRLPEQELQGS